MKLFKVMKDGGELSKVWGLFLVELKPLFSIVLLRFSDGSREAYHSHAFNAISWVLKGRLKEQDIKGFVQYYKASLIPVYTPREMCHKVTSIRDTYVLSFRGPWSDFWYEFLPNKGKWLTLTSGRKVVDVQNT